MGPSPAFFSLVNSSSENPALPAVKSPISVTVEYLDSAQHASRGMARTYLLFFLEGYAVIGICLRGRPPRFPFSRAAAALAPEIRLPPCLPSFCITALVQA